MSRLAELQMQKQETEELNKMIDALERRVDMLEEQNARMLQRLSMQSENCRLMAGWITQTERFHVWVIDKEWDEAVDDGDVGIALRFIQREGD